LGPPEDDISAENVVFRRKCRLPPEKKFPPIFFSLFFCTALNARGAEISSGGRRPPSPPQEPEVRCAERILTSSDIIIDHYIYERLLAVLSKENAFFFGSSWLKSAPRAMDINHSKRRINKGSYRGAAPGSSYTPFLPVKRKLRWVSNQEGNSLNFTFAMCTGLAITVSASPKQSVEHICMAREWVCNKT
jgi:hypothetical protein